MTVIIILLLLVAAAALYMAANAQALARKARGASARNEAAQLALRKERPD
jgi:hypothetical protein